MDRYDRSTSLCLKLWVVLSEFTWWIQIVFILSISSGFSRCELVACKMYQHVMECYWDPFRFIWSQKNTKQVKSDRTCLSRMNESHNLSKSFSSHQNTWQAEELRTGNTETSQGIDQKRALLCSERQERGRRSAHSAFWLCSMENTPSSKFSGPPPPLLCPCFPCIKSLLHFQRIRLLNCPAG